MSVHRRSRSADGGFRRADAVDIAHISRDTEAMLSYFCFYYRLPTGDCYKMKHGQYQPAPLWKLEEGIIANHLNYMKSPHDMYQVHYPRGDAKLERISLKCNGWEFDYNTRDNTKMIMTRGDRWRDMEMLAKIVFDLDILIDRYNLDRLTGRSTDIYNVVKCGPSHSITTDDISSSFSIVDDVHNWNDIF
jgi:hypothetical protein